MITVVAKAIYKEEKITKAKELIEELVQETLKEKGCISYKLFQDINDSRVLTLIEEWEDEESLERHSKSPHYTQLVPLIKDLRIDSQLNIYKSIVF